MHVRQGEAKGLGHAILCARPIVGDNDFVVILPDVILDENTADQTSENLAAMIKRFKVTSASQIMLDQVSQEEVSGYGIADINGVNLSVGESTVIKSMIEKPSIEESPSNLAAVGRYVLSKNIWPLLKKIPSGAGGEIQLTDAIDMLIELETVEAFRMKGISHDCGTKLGYLKAIVDYAMHDADLGAEFLAFINKKGLN
jgi:UTP--glucose-1-phosphate uridylyltransferase